MIGGKPARLRVRVIPRSGHTALAGKRGDALLVRLAAAPVDGAANDALIRFLSDLLGRPRRDFSIVAGEKNRDKHLLIAGLSDDQLAERLTALEP
jgi:uncharacterized protein (TIGR00251 family)